MFCGRVPHIYIYIYTSIFVYIYKWQCEIVQDLAARTARATAVPRVDGANVSWQVLVIG